MIKFKFIKEILKSFKSAAKKYAWWQWLFFVIGIITILSVLGAIFLAAGTEPSGKYVNNSIPSVDDPQFITAISNGLHQPSGTGGKVTTFVNGDAFRQSLLESLDKAQSSVNFSVFIWEKGEFNDQVISKLAEKQRQGVEVRILVDAFGDKSFTLKSFKPLIDAGGKVEEFRNIKFGQITHYQHRNHRRAIVIDGKVGYTGGMAIADKWLGSAQDEAHWRDNMYEVTGPMAQSLQGDFVDLWSALTGEFLTGDKFYPTELKDTDSNLKYILVSQTPTTDVQILSDFINNSIKAAKKKIIIENPYLVPNTPLLEALTERARNGVSISVIVPNKLNDSKLDRYASQYYWQKLMDAGIKIYEYQPTFNHTKFIMIDDQWTIIGSPNLNARSRRLDSENAFGILESNLANQHQQIFDDDLTHSIEITAQEWRKRNLVHKILEKISKVFDEQI